MYERFPDSGLGIISCCIYKGWFLVYGYVFGELFAPLFELEVRVRLDVGTCGIS